MNQDEGIRMEGSDATVIVTRQTLRGWAAHHPIHHFAHIKPWRQDLGPMLQRCNQPPNPMATISNHIHHIAWRDNAHKTRRIAERSPTIRYG